MDATAGSEHSATARLWPVLSIPALGAALAASGAVLTAPLRERPDPDPELLLGLAAAALGCAVVVAWAGAAALAVLAVLAGHRRWERLGGLCARCSPVLLRRAAATALGLQLVAAPGAVAAEGPTPFWTGGTAVQESADAAPAVPGTPVGAPAEGGGPGAATAPGREAPRTRGPEAAGPVVGPPPGPQPSPADRVVEGTVTVLRGDTLWSLAAAQLGPDASAEQISRAWPAWYELNRHVLRNGPHLLLPGQQLLVPPPGHP